MTDSIPPVPPQQPGYPAASPQGYSAPPQPGYPQQPYGYPQPYGYGPQKNGFATTSLVSALSAVTALVLMFVVMFSVVGSLVGSGSFNPATVLSYLGPVAGIIILLALVWFVGSILAVIFGHIGVSKAKKVGRGMGAAVTGLVIGYIFVLLFVLGQLSNLSS